MALIRKAMSWSISYNIHHIDTAPVYPASPGASERLVRTAKAGERGLTIDTKIEVAGDGPGRGSLKKEASSECIGRSMELLS